MATDLIACLSAFRAALLWLRRTLCAGAHSGDLTRWAPEGSLANFPTRHNLALELACGADYGEHLTCGAVPGERMDPGGLLWPKIFGDTSQKFQSDRFQVLSSKQAMRSVAISAQTAARAQEPQVHPRS